MTSPHHFHHVTRLFRSAETDQSCALFHAESVGLVVVDLSVLQCVTAAIDHKAHLTNHWVVSYLLRLWGKHEMNSHESDDDDVLRITFLVMMMPLWEKYEMESDESDDDGPWRTKCLVMMMERTRKNSNTWWRWRRRRWWWWCKRLRIRKHRNRWKSMIVKIAIPMAVVITKII